MGALSYSDDGRTANVRADLVSRSYVMALLRDRLHVVKRERFDLGPSSPGGVALVGDALARDLGFRAGANATRDDEAGWLLVAIATLERDRTLAGLRELRDAQPTVFEGESVRFAGEGG